MNTEYVTKFLDFHYPEFRFSFVQKYWGLELVIDRVKDYKYLTTERDVSWVDNLNSYLKSEVDYRLHLLMAEVSREFERKQNSTK